MSAVRKPQTGAGTVDVIDEVGKIVSKIAGIQLGERQRSMVETRLRKRMLRLQVDDLDDYWQYFQMHQAEEVDVLVSILTTHHTYFFREFAHFEYLEAKALPALISHARSRPDKTLRVWSAACSTGQEAYSLAMFLQVQLARLAPDVKFKIFATDVDAESVRVAKNGVYNQKEIAEVPLSLLGNHWAKGTGDIANFVKARSSIKATCRFETFNLLNFGSALKGEIFDIIFCRNVFIYFKSEQIKAISENFIRCLQPYGYLITGISETLKGMDLPLETDGPSVYVVKGKKPAAAKAPLPTPRNPASAVAKPVAAPSPAVLRVLCVDDSPSILTLMKQVLSPQDGFQVVGTAGNGVEAKQFLQANKVDVVTLDIHMPVETGIEYLQKNFSAHHPPVVMISSVSRDNADLAFKALSLGAADYIEKPALTNLKERGDEIRMKLRCAHRNGRSEAPLALAKSLAKAQTITGVADKIRLVLVNFSDAKKLASFLKELDGAQPATVVLMQGAKDALAEMAKALPVISGKPYQHLEAIDAKLNANAFYIADFATAFSKLRSLYAGCPTAIAVFGELSNQAATQVSEWRGAQILLEDLAKDHTPKVLLAKVTDIVPATSFGYMTSEFFGRLK